MQMVDTNGIITYETYNEMDDGNHIFKFQIIQLSEYIFAIRPLETKFCPKNDNDGSIVTQFEYDNNIHEKIAIQYDIDCVENHYISFLNYIYNNIYTVLSELSSICKYVFRKIASPDHVFYIYYLHPDGKLIKLIRCNWKELDMEAYDDSGNIIAKINNGDAKKI